MKPKEIEDKNKVFRSIDEFEKYFFPNTHKLKSLKLIGGYNTICPDCKGEMPDRYYGEPKIMSCISCIVEKAITPNMEEIDKK